MSHLSIKIRGKTPGFYTKIDSVQRNYNFKEGLINQPLLLSQSHNILTNAHKNMKMNKENKLNLNAIYNMRSNNLNNLFEKTDINSNNGNNIINVGLCSDDNFDLKPSITEDIPYSYQHSQLNLQGPHMKSNHQFFWKMSYEPKQFDSIKFWGSFNKKGKTTKVKVDIVDELTKLEKRLRSSKRPNTKQSIREVHSDNNTRPHTSYSTSNLNYKESGNDIEEFEYHAPKLLKHTKFIDNFQCPHGLTNLRKKEANTFQRANGFSISRSSLYDPYFAELRKRIRGGRRKKTQKTSGEDIGLDRAVFEQNFSKARNIMGKSLENFNK